MNLERWLAMPLARRNGRTVLALIAGMLCTIGFTGSASDPLAVMRAVALSLAGLYAVQHYLTLAGLSELRRRGLPHAAEAADAYRSPRAISSLDVAIAWLGFYLVAPLLRF